MIPSLKAGYRERSIYLLARYNAKATGSILATNPPRLSQLGLINAKVDARFNIAAGKIITLKTWTHRSLR